MTERQDTYRGIAKHYDFHLMDWYAKTYGRRLKALLAERGLAGSRLLDAGCGTGTLALSLAADGYEVTGVDLSEALLEIARGKDAAGAVRWRHDDLTRPTVDGTFDAAVSVADVFNHLPTLDDWEAAFRGIAERLRPGGVLFLDVLTCLGLRRQDAYSVRDHDDGVLILGVIWEPGSRRSTLKMTSVVPSSQPGLWERASETIVEWGQPVAGILDRLRRAGFDEPELPWSGRSDPELEERLAILARLP